MAIHSISAFIEDPDPANYSGKILRHLTLMGAGRRVTQAAVRAAVDRDKALAGRKILTVNYGEFSDVPFASLPEN